MATPTPTGPTADGQIFDTALRGYERRQVDEFVTARNEKITRLTADLAEMTRRHSAAEERAENLAREVQELRARPGGPQASEEGSFGFRAEKLLRMAEQEATEARAHASRESAAILEKARSDAEKHRHEAEQSLISRASILEQQAAQRASELQEREKQMADQLVAAREQADQMHAAATQAAERLRQQSEAAAEETRARAEAAAARQREQATQEIARLSSLQTGVRAELRRLSEVLSAELTTAQPDRRSEGEKAPAEKPAERTDSPQPAMNGRHGSR